MRKSKRIKCLFSIVAALIIINMMPANVFAETENADTVVYYGDQLPSVSGRTKEMIGQHYAQGRNAGKTYINRKEETYYSEQPSLTAPYSYGKLSDDTHISMTAMTNYYRWLVGVQPLKIASSDRRDLQAGALVRNWQFDHQINKDNKPSDMDDNLWKLGASASHNILARGYTPRGAVTGWLNEGYSLSNQSWNTIGHRTALLGSRIGGLQYGYAGSIAIGDIIDYSNDWSAPFATFPAAGFSPMNDVSAQASAWSVELNTSIIKIVDSSKVTVKVTDLSDGSSYVCTTANNKLISGSTLAFVQPSPEEESYLYQEGQKYKVEITGLCDVATNKDAMIVYTVDFFDVTEYADTYAEGYSVNDWNNIHITDRLNDTVHLKKIASILPSTINISTENGRKATAKVKEKWKVDEQNQCFVNSVDLSTMSDGVSDPSGVLKKISLKYKVDNYTGSFGIWDRASDFNNSKGFIMWRYNVSTDKAEVYQVSGDNDTGYVSKLRYDKNSAGFSILEDGYYTYGIMQK